MKTIWKFAVTVTEPALSLPAGAKILTVSAVQVPTAVADIFHLWAEVDPEQPSERRYLRVYGTGHALPDDPGRYVGTAFCAGGALVWHVYEEA